MTAFIGDYVLVRGSGYCPDIPLGIPLKVIGIEENPEPGLQTWNGCPEDLINGKDSFYALALPANNLRSKSLEIGYVKAFDCEIFKPKDEDNNLNLEITNVSEVIVEDKKELPNNTEANNWEGIGEDEWSWDDNSIFYDVE